MEKQKLELRLELRPEKARAKLKDLVATEGTMFDSLIGERVYASVSKLPNYYFDQITGFLTRQGMDFIELRDVRCYGHSLLSEYVSQEKIYMYELRERLRKGYECLYQEIDAEKKTIKKQYDELLKQPLPSNYEDRTRAVAIMKYLKEFDERDRAEIELVTQVQECYKGHLDTRIFNKNQIFQISKLEDFLKESS